MYERQRKDERHLEMDTFFLIIRLIWFSWTFSAHFGYDPVYYVPCTPARFQIKTKTIKTLLTAHDNLFSELN